MALTTYSLTIYELGGGGCTDTAAIYPEQIFCTKVEQKHPLFLAIFSFLNANLLGVFGNAFILALLRLCHVKVSKI